MPKYKKVKFGEETDIGYEVILWRNGRQRWQFDGKYHREDGPAFEDFDGNPAWCLNGKLLNKEWFLNNLDKIIPMKAWELFTPEELVRLKLDKSL